jgi:hypothetical protein
MFAPCARRRRLFGSHGALPVPSATVRLEVSSADAAAVAAEGVTEDDLAVDGR